MAEELEPDICIIGGGPAGIRLAIAAAEAGAPVVLVEKGTLGGANFREGGIPAQALLAAANEYEALRRGPAFGVTAQSLAVDFAGLRDHIRSVREAIAPNLSAERLAALGVTVIGAEAAFSDAKTVIAGDAVIRARRTVVATGAAPAPPRIAGLDRVPYLTPETAFELAVKPDRLVILGANHRALELAQAYNRLGVETVIVDEAPALAGEDPELATIVLDRLRAEGVQIRDNAKIASVAAPAGGGITMSLIAAEGEVLVEGSHLLVESGRRPRVEGLGLEVAGIMHDASGITVDRLLKTTNGRVYAIGDVIAGSPLVSRAEYEADYVARAILYRLPFRENSRLVPCVTFTDPALARLGLSEAEAQERHRGTRVLRYPFIENDLSQAERRPAGVIKVITTSGGRVLGAGVVGHGAGELIALLSLAVGRGLDIAGLARFVPSYPSRAEVARRVALTYYGPGLTPPWRQRIIELLRKFG
jgi:pyruvate/2-oxoglutarate dehydrogenase complex dihydrolipoamide dehydrogenase (E3) component